MSIYYVTYIDRLTVKKKHSNLKLTSRIFLGKIINQITEKS